MRTRTVILLLLVAAAGGSTARQPRAREGHRGVITALACSLDGKLLASGAQDGAVRVWDVMTLQCRFTMPGHGRMVTALASAPDGKTLASAGYDRGIHLWDVATGKETAHLRGLRSE